MFVNPRKRWPRRGRGSLLFRGSGVASELASYNEQRCILEYLLEFVRFMVDLFELLCEEIIKDLDKLTLTLTN